MNQATVLSRTEWWGWLVILLGLGGFGLWAAVYPMQQGVPGTGFVVGRAEKVAVVAHTTGLVAQLPKKAGDAVRAGDLLMEFDGGQLRATERTLLQSKAGLERSIPPLKSALRARGDQIDALRGQHLAATKLVDAGFASANSLATIRNQLAIAESESLELLSKIEQSESALKEAEERIASVRHDMTLLRLTSPVDGQVMNLTLKSSGVNVVTGTPILEIAPQTRQLWVDARIPVQLGDRLKPGMSVDVMFPTLEGDTTQRIAGLLEYLSADRMSDPRTGQAYLEARIGLDAASLAQAPNLRTGLPATVMINTGTRTLLSYVIRPVIERVNRGMQ